MATEGDDGGPKIKLQVLEGDQQPNVDASMERWAEHQARDFLIVYNLAAAMLNICRAFEIKDLNAVAALVRVASVSAADVDFCIRFKADYGFLKQRHDELKKKREESNEPHDA